MDEIRSELDRALIQMLNGSKAGGADYSVGILMLGAIINDLEVPATDPELTAYPVFGRILDARDRMQASGDAQGLERMKTDIRESLAAAVHWIRDRASEKMTGRKMVN